MVRYAILGPVELCYGTRRVTVGGPRQVALLALLLVNANRALSSDRLIDALWDDLDQATALKRLWVTVTRLRRVIDTEGKSGESVLRKVAGGYLLAVRPGELDVEVFQSRMQDGCRTLEAGDARGAKDLFSEALELWRGPALADVAHREFAQPEIRRLDELRLTALEARIDAELRLAEHTGLVGELEVLVAAHRGRERLAGQLMLALYRCGRQAEALEVYARTRAYLSGELGLEPGPALQAIQAGILAQSPALQPGGGARGSMSDAAADDEAAPESRVVLALPRSLHVHAGLPFVGRDAQLERLREHWRRVCAGTRSAVVVGGEPGIGKTRLAAELGQVVLTQQALVLYGRCDEGPAVPYQPFVEALRPYARAVGLTRLRTELGDLAPELGRMLPELTGLGEPLRGDPESERFALFESVAALLEGMTRRQPALVVLDDLHWATDPTLLLLRHLLRSDRQFSVLLLCTYRETELNPGGSLARLLANLQRDTGTDRLSIGGLDEPAIAALLHAMVGLSPDRQASRLVPDLRAQTAGNPFFLCGLLANLADAGQRSRPAASAPSAVQLKAPESVRQVISDRVSRLSAPAVRALRLAAVAGPTFSFVLLERVLGERSGLFDALDDAVAARLLTEAEDGDYTFAHALVRQTIYEELGSAWRMRLHRRLGEALETLGDIENHVEALAYHFAQTAADGQGVKAADYALAAGRSATARLGYDEAAAHYERGLRALALTGKPHEQRRCGLLLALGEARWRTGELDKARQACQQAAELAEKLGDSRALAHAALGCCGPYRFEVAARVTRPVAELLQRALDALDDDDSSLRARLMGRLAAFTHIEERKPVLARQAVQMARRVADKATLAGVLASALWATRARNGLYDSMAMTQELGRVADDVGNRGLRALAHWWLLDVMLEQGDIEAVEHELEALRRLTETRPERISKWALTVLQANHAHLRGQLKACEKLAYEALAHRYKGHDESASNAFGVQLFFIRREQGRLDELLPILETFVDKCGEMGPFRCVLAYFYAQLGHREQARQQLDGLAADFSDIPHDTFWLSNVSLLSEVVGVLGDVPRAQTLYEALLPYADCCAVTWALLCHGPASRPLGLLATTLSRHDEAARHFKRALEMSAQIKSPLWLAHTQSDLARLLLLRNDRGDRDEALRLLEDALATAELLGLNAVTSKARLLTVAAEAVTSLSPPR
jgi:predicted ATPase/DNA-binding SARP family transcriptional activator